MANENKQPETPPPGFGPAIPMRRLEKNQKFCFVDPDVDMCSSDWTMVWPMLSEPKAAK